MSNEARASSASDDDLTLRRWAPVIVALVACLVYANALRNGFVLDDEGIVLRNALVHHVSGVWHAFATPYWPNGSGQYRPLVIASFSAEWALWHHSPVGYHAINIAWHACASVLLFAFARRWFSVTGAFVAALLFAVHPVHTEAVANVVGRSEVMAASGVLAMLLLHGKRSRWGIVAFAFALLSKEHALLAPLIAGCIDVLDEKRSLQSAKPMYVGYGIVALAWGAVVFALFHDKPFANVDPFWTSMSAPSRWLTMLGVVPVWVRLWFFPAYLSADYSPQVTRAWPEQIGMTVIGVLILMAGIVLAVRFASRRRVVTLAIVILAVTMLPVANVLVPTGVIVAERTLYLSSVGAVLLAAVAFEWIAGKNRAAFAVAGAVLVCAGGLRTWTRNHVWKSNRDLLLTTAEENPNGSWTHAQLGRIYAANGGFPQAVDEYLKSLVIFAHNPVIWSDGINAAINARQFTRADSMVVAAERAVPDHYLVKVAHAHAAFESARFAEALEASRAAIAIAPDSAAPHFFAGLAWTGLQKPDSAIAEFRHVPPGHQFRPMTDSVLKNLRGQ